MQVRNRLMTHRVRFARIAVGLYLAVRFAHIYPFAGAIYGANGTLPDASLNPFAIGALEPLFAVIRPEWAVASLFVLAVAYSVGWCTRTSALLLVVGQALLFNRNQLTLNPAMPFLCVWLLGHALLPRGDAPRAVHRLNNTLWWITGVAYTYSGIEKLLSPSWRSGDAGAFILASPLGRDHVLVHALEHVPMLLAAGTWAMLALELFMLPLIVRRAWRSKVWLATMLLHLMLLVTVNIAEISIGMLVFHLTLFDPTWPRARIAHEAQAARRAGWGERGGAVGGAEGVTPPNELNCDKLVC